MQQFFADLSQQAYDEVASRHPIGADTPTRTNRDGTVVNMTREAMLDRLHTFGAKVNDALGITSTEERA